METSHRSIHPNFPGVPWWGAVLIATAATAVGYAVDAGSGQKELTQVFAAFYIAGCVAAVLAVRQAAVFTAIIQPPLILFCAVPGAYWLFHGGKIDSLKDLLINCGYPLIERFPLMLGTAGGVLLIGLIRWYFGMAHRTGAAARATGDDATGGPRTSFFAGISGKLRSLWADISDHTSGDEADDAPTTDPQPAHAKSRRTASTRRTRRSGSDRRTPRARARSARPPLEDEYGPTAEHPRRQQRRKSPASARDAEAADPPRRSRRRQADPDLREQPPREARRSPYERPAPRRSRFDPYDRYEPPENSGPAERFNRYDRYAAGYEPYEPYEPPYEARGRPGAPGHTSTNPGHQPVSRVRYRTSASRDESRDRYRDRPREELRDEPRPDRRSRSRAPRRRSADSWEYDF